MNHHQTILSYLVVMIIIGIMSPGTIHGRVISSNHLRSSAHNDNLMPCPEYNHSSSSIPQWPMNKALIFSVSQSEDTSSEKEGEMVVISFSNVVKFIGAIQYVRISSLNTRNTNIVSSELFDSGYTAEEEFTGDGYYLYQNYSSMFSNDKYESVDNGDCTVDISYNLSIQSLLSNKHLFRVTEDKDLIRIDIPLYLGYAVKATQEDRYWQNREYLFTARILINTLVKRDGSKDAMNAACSSTISQDQKGVITCAYSSNSNLQMSDFDLIVDNGQLIMYPYYCSSYAGRAQAQFRTVNTIESLTEFTARIQASVCVLGEEEVCQSTIDYRSDMNVFSFQPGSGVVSLVPEAQMVFSTTITKFDSSINNDTIINRLPEFFILVRTRVLKTDQRIQPGTDSISVKLTSPPRYHLPGYPEFPTANTITSFHEPNFPVDVDPDVLNSPYINYILRFDNSNERYSKASESPLLFQVKFNLEPKTESNNRRLSQLPNHRTNLLMSKTLKPDCIGSSCHSSCATSISRPDIYIYLLVVILYWIFMHDID